MPFDSDHDPRGYGHLLFELITKLCGSCASGPVVRIAGVPRARAACGADGALGPLRHARAAARAIWPLPAAPPCVAVSVACVKRAGRPRWAAERPEAGIAAPARSALSRLISQREIAALGSLHRLGGGPGRPRAGLVVVGGRAEPGRQVGCESGEPWRSPARVMGDNRYIIDF